MRRIIIIGCPGSGKSTLARNMAQKLGLPLVHLDKLHWRGNWEEAPREEFDALLRNELEKPEWIIDGNYGRTLETRLGYCDTVIYLDLPRIVCMTGVIRRVLGSYGKLRPDMGGECKERFDGEFMKYIWGFNKTYREKYRALLDARTDKQVIILRSHRQINKFVKAL